MTWQTHAAEQGRRASASISTACWEQLGADHLARVGDQIRLPENEFLTGSYTSPITQQAAVRCARLRHHPGLEGPIPAGGSSLEFTKPLPDVFKALIAVTEQGGLIPSLLYRGAGQTGLGPFIRVSGHIASAQASVSYVTGAHAMKFGFLDTFGDRHEDYDEHRSNVRYRFNNGVPNQITEIATPYGFTSNLGAELGVFAQDKWTLARLTLNLGARFDYLNITSPNSISGPAARAQSEHHVPAERLLAGRTSRRASAPSTTCSATARRRSRSTWAATSSRSV